MAEGRILEIEHLQYLCNRLTDRDKSLQKQADFGYKSMEC